MSLTTPTLNPSTDKENNNWINVKTFQKLG